LQSDNIFKARNHQQAWTTEGFEGEHRMFLASETILKEISENVALIWKGKKHQSSYRHMTITCNIILMHDNV
jgi:hypothetical protein